MKKSIKLLLPLLTLMISSMAQATDEIEIEIQADSRHEECFHVGNVPTLSYQYTASSPLNFNLHYHTNDGMNYIVELEASIKGKEKVKSLDKNQVYCLMWVNTQKVNSVLKYNFTME